MCGRAVQAKGVIPLAVFSGIDVPDSRVANVPPRYNAAPSQELWVIRQNRDTGERSLDLLKWGLIPYWCKEKPKPPPINAKAETVARLPMFRDAYARRRCIMALWTSSSSGRRSRARKVKQPYAIGMKDGSPFGQSPELWENLERPAMHGRVGEDICRADHGSERTRGRDSRSYAADPQARGLRSMARDRAGSERPVAAIRGRRDDHVAHFDAGELTAQRRCRPSDANAAREQREPERRA